MPSGPLRTAFGNPGLVNLYAGKDPPHYSPPSALYMPKPVPQFQRERLHQGRHLKAANPIVEATSGNTGIAFFAAGTAMGHLSYVPDWMSQEPIKLDLALYEK